MFKLYNDIADWWPLLSPVEDYADEAAFFLKVLSSVGLPDSPSLLELGSGGGNNAFYLKKHFFQITLTDLSSAMLAVSRELNPECEHLAGDMRTLRLEREYDVVFIHDAIDYMTTAHDLRAALETAFIHCKVGGVALVVPDHVRETFESSTESGGADGNGRALRYLEWTYDPDETDNTVVTEYAYLLREGEDATSVGHERHIHGLFPRAEWLQLLSEVGFNPETVRDSYGRDIFVAYKPLLVDSRV